MKAHKMKVTIPEDHQVEIHLPEDFPSGPAEVIVLAGSGADKGTGESQQQQMRRALQELRAIQWTPEEERVLDEFEEFRRQHRLDFSSLTEEEP